jgi:hypothetical protein
MAGFIQCFISFFEKMNNIEYNSFIPHKSVVHKEIDDFFKSLKKKSNKTMKKKKRETKSE